MTDDCRSMKPQVAYIYIYYIILYYIYIDTHTHTPECYINVKLKVVNLSCCYCPYINDIALFNV